MRQRPLRPLTHHQVRFDLGALEKLEKPHAEDRTGGSGYSDKESVVLSVHSSEHPLVTDIARDRNSI